MSRGDQLIERASEKLRDLSQRAAARGGASEQLAQELAEDAEFIRKLKPSLVMARIRGHASTDEKPGSTAVAPAGPQLGKRPRPPGEPPNPFVVVGAALVAGIVVAKVIDWRSHAHPRDS